VRRRPAGFDVIPITLDIIGSVPKGVPQAQQPSLELSIETCANFGGSWLIDQIFELIRILLIVVEQPRAVCVTDGRMRSP
jgi:hypothetical protein